MTSPKLNSSTNNEEIRQYILNRDKHICQWPGCGNALDVDVLFILETDTKNDSGVSAYKNGITLCPRHMDIVNLHDKAFGPLVFDLIQLVEFENDLQATEVMYKEILKR